MNAAKIAAEPYVMVTYWKSFEELERPHADEVFNDIFSVVAGM